MKKYLGDEGFKLVTMTVGVVATLVAMTQFQNESSKWGILITGVALSLLGTINNELIFSSARPPESTDKH